MTQGINKQVRVFPAIEAEFHLSKICREMLCADLVPTSNDAALQERECILNSVRVNVSSKSDILFCGMIDGFVFVGSYSFLICRKIIGNDDINIGRNIFFYVLGKRSHSGIFGMEEAHISPTLANTNHTFFVVFSALIPATALSTANIGFVHFNSTVQHWFFRLAHSSTNAMTEIPCCLVTDSQGTLHLISRHSFARFHQKQHRHKPSFQRQMCIMENGLRENTKLGPAVNTLEFLLSGNLKHPIAFASNTFNADRPAQLFQDGAALFVCRKHLSEVSKSHG